MLAGRGPKVEIIIFGIGDVQTELKSEFKAAMLFPYPENGSGAGSNSGAVTAQLSGMVADFFNVGSKGAPRLGASDFVWAKGRNDQSTNTNDTDAVYLLWRWVDCCEFN